MGMMIGWFGVGAALVLVPAALAPRAAAAQVVIEAGEVDCRCVDREGNPIANCTCIRTGDFPRRSFTLAQMDLARRAQVGVHVDASQDDAEVGGVRMTDVVDGSPAERAGLRAGDVVISIAGRSVLSPLEAEAEAEFDEETSLATQRFIEIVGDLEPGELVEIVFLREGERRTLRVTPERSVGVFSFRLPEGALDFDMRGFDMRDFETSLDSMRGHLRGLAFRFREGGEERERMERERVRVAEMAKETLERARDAQARSHTLWVRAADPCTRLRGESRRAFTLGATNCVDGVRLAPMNDGLAAYFGTDEGVLVTEVADSAALGLRPGDVILSIGEREVEDVEDVRRILESYEVDEPVTLRVRREDREIQVSGMRRAP